MFLRNVSIAIIFITVFVWIAWDVYVYFLRDDVEATFSRIIYSAALHPVGALIPLSMGALMGHFFYSLRRLDMLAVLFTGIVGGALFWRQKPEEDEKEKSNVSSGS